MTLVEAMRCGLPVVSTDCPVGPREILRHGEDGFLVPSGEVEGIAWGLRRLMADEILRRDMGEAALRNAARYDPAAVADRYVNLFEDAARRRAATVRGYRAPAGARRAAVQATVPPTAIGAATVDVTTDGAGWLRFSADGPGEAATAGSSCCVNHRPTASGAPTCRCVPHAPTWTTVALAIPRRSARRCWTNSATDAGR
ncbi:glycosyltransferase [Streptomyces thinghirensis]|nr:glycosyltransferase [Streptomyces thinghirensis]